MKTLQVIEGKLLDFAETGSEGIIWSVQTDWKEEKCSYDHLYEILNGDFLVIWCGLTNKLEFADIIDFDYSTHHWRGIQRNWDPGDWGKMFREGKMAKLVRYSEQKLDLT